jgi:uncharacterized membrane protein
MELRNNLGTIIVAFLALVQGALRTYFGLAGAGALGVAARDQVMALIDTPVSNEMLMIAAPFLLLGVLGLAATVGLGARQRWAVPATLMVSAATIIYDLWAVATVQSSALIGLVVPVITIAFLVLRKDAFRSAKAVRA